MRWMLESTRYWVFTNNVDFYTFQQFLWKRLSATIIYVILISRKGIFFFIFFRVRRWRSLTIRIPIIQVQVHELHLSGVKEIPLMKTFEQQKALVRRLNVIDDVLFHKIAENQEVCEEILRIILNDPELEIIESKVQRFLRNVGAHSVILDLLCSDKRKTQFNVEGSMVPTLIRYLPKEESNTGKCQMFI